MRRVCRQSALVAFVIAWATAVLATPPRIVPFTAHGDQIMNVWVSEDQQLLLTYSQDSLLKIWQITSRRLVQTFDLKLINISGLRDRPRRQAACRQAARRLAQSWLLSPSGMIEDGAG